ncbi:MAG: TolB family protein [Kofleriaceae bacterium]
MLATACVVVAGCAGRAGSRPRAEDGAQIAIVAAERGPRGARLVAIDEAGDRQFALISPAEAMVRDTHPAISPDRTWVVFASSRGRRLDETSLWIARLGVQTPPARLTDGASIETHPVWTPDGRSIVFASTRDGGDFDLWQLHIDRGAPSGAPVQLTSGRGHEVTPTISRDGAIAFTAIAVVDQKEAESHLEVRQPDGSLRRLTDGPADTSPAFAPDGHRIAFSRPQLHNGVADTDIWLLDLDAPDSAAVPIVEVPMTNEGGPVWSRDGRFVFATSLWRGATGAALLSSVVHVDLSERAHKVRILMDHAGAVSRLTPAVVAPTLDTSALRLGHEYLPALARLVARKLERQRIDRSRSQSHSP